MPDSDARPVSDEELGLLRELTNAGLEDIDVVLKCDGLRNFDAEYQDAIDVALVPGLVLKVLPIDRVLASKRAANRVSQMERCETGIVP